MSVLAPKYRLEILIPLHDNEGVPIDLTKLQEATREIWETHNACRTQPFSPHLGWWREPGPEEPGMVYRDWTVLLTVDVDREEQHVQWLRDFQRRLEETFQQIEIYVAVTEIFWLARD